MLTDHRDGLSSSSFSLILDSSVDLSAGIQSAGDLVSETLMGSNPAFSRGRQLVSFRFEYRLPVPEHRNLQQQICNFLKVYGILQAYGTICICALGAILCFTDPLAQNRSYSYSSVILYSWSFLVTYHLRLAKFRFDHVWHS